MKESKQKTCQRREYSPQEATFHADFAVCTIHSDIPSLSRLTPLGLVCRPQQELSCQREFESPAAFSEAADKVNPGEPRVTVTREIISVVPHSLMVAVDWAGSASGQT